MASLWKHPQSRFWTACFTDPSGRRRKRSTKTTDRRDAQKLADQYEETARKKRTARQVRQVIQDLHRSIVGEELKVPSLSEYVAAWTSEKSARVGIATAAFYRKACGKFVSFMGEKANVSLDEVTRDHIRDFRAFNAKKVSPTTVNHDLKCLRMLFKAARRDGLIADDPTEFVETIRASRAVPRRPFTPKELKAVLKVADEEWQSMILVGLYTGQRLADVASLEWERIDVKTRTISLTARKTGRHSLIPIAPPLVRHLKSLAKVACGKGPIHPQAFSIVAKHGRTGILSSQFADLLAKAGLRDEVSHTREHEGRTGRRGGGALSFHCLRHTAVTMLKEAGVPAAVVMEMIGHDSVQVSQHYTHVGSEALAKAAATMPDLGKPKKP